MTGLFKCKSLQENLVETEILGNNYSHLEKKSNKQTELLFNKYLNFGGVTFCIFDAVSPQHGLRQEFESIR